MWRLVPALSEQFGAEEQPLFIVETQQPSGTTADGRQGHDLDAIQAEMVQPAVLAWVEQGYKSACHRIVSRNVGTLEAVTAKAGIGEIIERRLSAMLLTDDVIGLMGG